MDTTPPTRELRGAEKLPDVYAGKRLSGEGVLIFRRYVGMRAVPPGNIQSALRRFGVNTLIQNDMI